MTLILAALALIIIAVVIFFRSYRIVPRPRPFASGNSALSKLADAHTKLETIKASVEKKQAEAADAHAAIDALHASLG